MLIRCIDFETTGMEPPAEVCEVGWFDWDPDGMPKWGRGGDSLLVQIEGDKIPPEASAVHHIIKEDLAAAMTFSAVMEFVGDAKYYAAHNDRFERQWFDPDGTIWIDTYRCAVRMYPDAPSHSLQFLRYYLDLKLFREKAERPHRAGPDAYVCAALLARMYTEGKHRQLIDWSKEPALLPRMKFGKHKDSKFADLPLDYLQWMQHSDLMKDEDLAFTVASELKRRRK